MSTIELTKKLRELKELQVMREEIQEEITAIENSLKADMNRKGVDEMTVDIFKVRYKTVISNRFDTKAFKATHSELYSQYTKQTECKRFTVA